jgi:ketosteroid isomerase-like protein
LNPEATSRIQRPLNRAKAGGFAQMSDIYGINVAKTEMREACATGDVDRLLRLFEPDGFTDMSTGEPSRYGAAAIDALRERTSELFKEYSVKMSIIIIEIVASGNSAHDHGWHEFALTPKRGGAAICRRERYFEMWTKKPSGGWKISLFITNNDVKEKLAGSESHWFLSQERSLLAN